MGERPGNVDDAFDALSHAQKRSVLVALLDDQTSSERQLLGDGGKLADEEWRITMEHKHLPKLEEYGFIDWDGESVTEVSKGPAFEDIRPLLELLDAESEKLPGTWIESPEIDA